MNDDKEFDEKTSTDGIDSETMNLVDSLGVDPGDAEAVAQIIHELGTSPEDAIKIHEEGIQ